MKAAVEPQNRRILLVDGPAVMGWDVWRMMDEQNSMSLLREQLTLMQEQGYLQRVSIDSLTHCLSGVMNESALWLAQNPDDQKRLEETMTVITLMLNGLHYNDR